MTSAPTRIALMALLLALVWPTSAAAADMLNWDADADRIEAQVETWTVPQVLRRVAAVTGWRIFVDPGIEQVVRTKFQGKATGEALQRLLGPLNYALVPETNEAPKLYVFRTARSDATKAIAPVESTRRSDRARIVNELVVTLKPGEKIDEVARRLGAKVVGRSDEQNTYRLQFEEADDARLARERASSDPSVASVDDNYYVSRPETPELLGGPGKPLALRPKSMPDGQYVVVGLIDSVVQAKEANLGDFVLPGLSVAGEVSAPGDGPTHGTSMAETILRGRSFASSDADTIVRILPVNVYPASDSARDMVATSTFDVAAGIHKAVENGGATIVNLSLGSEGDSAFLRETIRSAQSQGVVFLAAAGNEPVNTPIYPAAYTEVIAVTATDRQGNIAPYANRGDFVDAAAPGTSLATFRGQQYYITGTSASTAYASGLAASIAEAARQRGVTTPLEPAIREALRRRPN